MIKKLFLLLMLLTAITLGVAFNYYQKYQNFLNEPVFAEEKIVQIKKGQNFKNFTNYIKQNQANGTDWQWRLFAKLEKVGRWLKVGEFRIANTQTPMQMMQKIKDNKVLTYQFTIVEGLNWRELKDVIYANKVLVHEVDNLSNEQLLDIIGSNRKTPEGLFLPETYQFVKGDSDVDVLKRAHIALKKELQKHWQTRKEKLPYKNSYQLLTMASIVEKETAIASERDIIAGVFVRRLQKNMRLQTDPTVIYGLGENYDGNIRRKDLTTDTPYNTYTRFGLTPTPIAMASIQSIAASAQPKDGKSLFFVANNKGGHYFSETYDQHLKAVKGYLKGEKL